ncbi:carboxymuconolactone decarboxylase family protein [Aeromonas hydrophila]|uniref:carboxymuconolactone decarboxylase family protein n=1 Tax=Aeromonas hydrophila TaxID=644 RepID=UPI002B27961E|nr:carboxymuconolactone decarboxylase family protein [Aeromonas hydrophila]
MGVSRETIIEILLQIAVYAGVPACMNGISAARKAFAAHDKAKARPAQGAPRANLNHSRVGRGLPLARG